MKALTADHIVKIVDAILKGLSEKDRQKIKQHLLKKYCTWLPSRKIAELTGAQSRSMVTHNMALLRRDKSLMSFVEDMETILER